MNDSTVYAVCSSGDAIVVQVNEKINNPLRGFIRYHDIGLRENQYSTRRFKQKAICDIKV